MPVESRAPFLGVTQSIGERLWADRLDEVGHRLALTIAQRHRISDIVARVLASRIDDADAAPAYLEPTLRDLMPDPSKLIDMDMAADRIAKAVRDGEKIAIFGDYDVDGATSAAVLARFLRSVGGTCEIYIPDRIFEGYGPNNDALDSLKERGADLLVTVDCGMTSFAALSHAESIGLQAVVIDHHQPGDGLPAAEGVVNPNRDDDMSGLGYLAAVGVTFMTVVAINRALRTSGVQSLGTNDLMELLPMVALGTVSDVVPLTGLNRAFVRRGLDLMARRDNPGLRALCDVARLAGPPTPYHLGFVLGPRINAGGRIGDAGLGARLLAGDDSVEAEKIAVDLDRLNRERQQMEAQMLEMAMAEADLALGKDQIAPFLLHAHDDWHPGVVGLVASRLKDRFSRPAFAISLDRTGIGTGSARSVAGVDIGKVVRGAVAEKVLVKGGGHGMAAGFTVPAGGVGALRSYLEEALSGKVDTDKTETLSIDAAVTASGLSRDLMTSIEAAGPFGAGSPDPTFVLPMHRVIRPKKVGANHVRCTLLDGGGGSVEAIAFRATETPLGDALFKSRTPLHFAVHGRLDRWGGKERVQCHIVDAASPQSR